MTAKSARARWQRECVRAVPFVVPFVVPFAVFGCLAERPPGAIVLRGRTLTVNVAPERVICPGSLEELDRFVEHTAAYLGVPVPGDATYNLYPSSRTDLCISRESCAFRTSVLSNLWILEHELVHVITRDMGDPPAFLTEGIAVALDPTLGLEEVMRMDVRAFPLERHLEGTAFQTLGYPDGRYAYEAAGSFVRWVLRTHGVEAFKRWYGSLTRFSEPLAIAQSYFVSTGQRLEDAIAAWRASPAHATRTAPQTLPRAGCDGPAAVPDAVGNIVLPGPYLNCEAEVHTTLDGLSARGFTVTQPGRYVVAESQFAPVGILVGDCASDALWFDIENPASTTLVIDLAPGRYSLGVVIPTQNPPYFDVALRASVPGIPSMCEHARPIASRPYGLGYHYVGDPTLWTAPLALADGTAGRTTWLRFNTGLVDIPSSTKLWRDDTDAPVEASVCDDACVPSTCTPFSTELPIGHRLATGDFTVQLRAAPTNHRVHLRL